MYWFFQFHTLLQCPVCSMTTTLGYSPPSRRLSIYRPYFNDSILFKKKKKYNHFFFTTFILNHRHHEKRTELIKCHQLTDSLKYCICRKVWSSMIENCWMLGLSFKQWYPFKGMRFVGGKNISSCPHPSIFQLCIFKIKPRV